MLGSQPGRVGRSVAGTVCHLGLQTPTKLQCLLSDEQLMIERATLHV
jgi:hypothetical protein